MNSRSRWAWNVMFRWILYYYMPHSFCLHVTSHVFLCAHVSEILYRFFDATTTYTSIVSPLICFHHCYCNIITYVLGKGTWKSDKKRNNNALLQSLSTLFPARSSVSACLISSRSCEFWTGILQMQSISWTFGVIQTITQSCLTSQ